MSLRVALFRLALHLSRRVLRGPLEKPLPRVVRLTPRQVAVDSALVVLLDRKEQP